MRFTTMILFLSVTLFAGCGPIYETDYRIVPPNTDMGRQCANNCLLAQQNCQQSCSYQHSQCEENERLRGENEYLRYVHERESEGKEIKRSQDSFTDSWRCNDDDCEEACGGSYRICHTNCGGQVIPHTYCSAFCD